MSGDEVYLRHILDAIHRIESYISKGRESFLSDQMPQDAVMRQLEVIGEAVKQLSSAVSKSGGNASLAEVGDRYGEL